MQRRELRRAGCGRFGPPDFRASQHAFDGVAFTGRAGPAGVGGIFDGFDG